MQTATYPNLPLHELLRATARRYPDRTAIWFEGESISYARFDAESNRLANALAAIGTRKGDRVGVFLPNCPECELAIYAVLKLGAITCPMNPSYRAFEITHILNDSGASVLLTHARLWPYVEAVRHQLPSLREVVVLGGEPTGAENVHDYAELTSRHTDAPPTVDVSMDDLAILPYSSGTTGKPKGVMLTHRNLSSCHVHLAMVGEIGPEDVVLLYVPLSHIYGISAIMGMAVYAGSQQVLMERFDLARAIRLIEERGVTCLHVVPPVVLALLDDPGLTREQLRSIRYISNAAAPLAPEVACRVAERFQIPVIQSYGLTEASPALCHSPVDPARIKRASVGVPCPDTERRIVDLETGERTLGPHEVGEIVVHGPQVMQGYWNDPRETARVLRDGWLYTGDIGWIDEDGYLFVSDRKKEMIKFKSFSIAPAELEAMLLEHPDVADCGVIGVPDQEAGEVPKAFVVARPGATLNPEVLSRFAAERVAGYKQIRQWAFIDKIPRTPSGKILRRSLRSFRDVSQ